MSPISESRIVVAAYKDGSGEIQPLDGQRQHTADLATTLNDIEQAQRPRWIWADTNRIYPRLINAGIHIGRAYDVALAEAAILGYQGRWGEPSSVEAAWARAHGMEPPKDHAPDNPTQPALFDDEQEIDLIEATINTYESQQESPVQQIAQIYEPSAVTRRQLDLLIAADSAGALAAAEMSHVGLPWDNEIHDRILTEALGPRTPVRPARLQKLADEIATKLHAQTINPDSAAELIKAFQREGITLETTRAWQLKQIDHPAVEPLLEYKSLARLHTANGWAWQDSWVSRGRFRPEYVAAAVVSGRWATRGGGALQIPKAVRAAVRAEPGYQLVVADAQQLEPRILAALSQDDSMTKATAHGDLYQALAEQSFNNDRAQAKVGLLSAMYGGATPAIGTLRRSYPAALELLEKAATAGESGRMVRSVLGRTCPAARSGWDAGPEQQARARARDRGRFTRNFVIQASAADWAAVLIATLRTTLPKGAELVFFQHDEVIVHCPTGLADDVSDTIDRAAAQATHLVLGPTPVRLLLKTATVTSYADAK
jgi:DNA polymerase I-like protein with 3'-5' exonuclease and polymerase domains